MQFAPTVFAIYVNMWYNVFGQVNIQFYMKGESYNEDPQTCKACTSEGNDCPKESKRQFFKSSFAESRNNYR